MRYADDFVVLARRVEPGIGAFLESTLMEWLNLEINRKKTRTVDLKANKASLDFWGFTFRWDRDKFYQTNRRYLNVFPSKKAQQRERQQLHGLTSAKMRWKSMPELIADLNRHLRGWANYFAFAYPTPIFRQMDWYVLQRLRYNMRRRSQRPYRLPEGVTSDIFCRQLGLLSLRELSLLSGSRRMPPATLSGEPHAGNPHVRFDEGAARRALQHRGSLYSTHPSSCRLRFAETLRFHPKNAPGGARSQARPVRYD